MSVFHGVRAQEDREETQAAEARAAEPEAAGPEAAGREAGRKGKAREVNEENVENVEEVGKKERAVKDKAEKATFSIAPAADCPFDCKCNAKCDCDRSGWGCYKPLRCTKHTDCACKDGAQPECGRCPTDGGSRMQNRSVCHCFEPRAMKRGVGMLPNCTELFEGCSLFVAVSLSFRLF